MRLIRKPRSTNFPGQEKRGAPGGRALPTSALVQFGFLALLASAGTLLAQERIIWMKQDYDPLLNVAFSHDGSMLAGSMLALGREDSNTSDFLRASDGKLIRSFSGSHNTTNDLVFTLDNQYLINGTGS